jgi:Carboxysome Shell Carbonic Anhydrase
MSLLHEIITLNARRSDEFCTPVARDTRTLYSSQHPTKMLVFKCMDGRINLPLITGVPMGQLHPFRHIGGKFVLGDPYLGRLVLDAKEDAMRAGRPTLALCTYHYSKGNEHRGCAGHSYDTKAARKGAYALKQEFEEVFGSNNPAIAAIVVGIETDEDALIFCNKDGLEIKMEDYLSATNDEIQSALNALYPNLTHQMLHDLLPLALGNRDHIAHLRTQKRPVTELVHNENIICVGRGFDWLHLPNRALIIGPYGHIDKTWREAIVVAGNIVLDNYKNNETLQNTGSLLLISAPYTDMNERGIAVAKATYFAEVAKNALLPVAQELRFETLVGVTDMETMRYHPLNER